MNNNSNGANSIGISPSSFCGGVVVHNMHQHGWADHNMASKGSMKVRLSSL